jgi:NAD(P)-dependent dehydrogenase (short-subunit alcohol dehydrogenase family)
MEAPMVIVTGGAGGIGRSQAIELGRRGARVVVNDLGGSPRDGGADLDSILAVNLRGTFRMARAAYRAMKEGGGGRIVTLTSASGLSGAFGQAAYATTKMGVIGLTRSVAWEGTRYGIRVNALAPAAFDTRLFSVFTPEGDAALRGRPPELEISLDSAEYIALLTASRVTPMALALVHGSCPVTAQVFGATGGYFCRYAISHTEGATFGPHPRVEDVAGNWDRIRDESLPNELDGEAMAWGVRAYSSRLRALASELAPVLETPEVTHG